MQKAIALDLLWFFRVVWLGQDRRLGGSKMLANDLHSLARKLLYLISAAVVRLRSHQGSPFFRYNVSRLAKN